MMVSPEILTAPVSVTFAGTHIIFSTVAMYICNILLVNYHSSLNSEPLPLLALYPGPSHVRERAHRRIILGLSLCISGLAADPWV